jgi:hypothetical protein
MLISLQDAEVTESLCYRTQAATLRALGTSLADIAAFMHEIELEMGLLSLRADDRRGIERLRALALLMEKLELRLDAQVSVSNM